MERFLGPGEHLFWLSDRWAPRHFALCVQTPGRIDPKRVEAALLAAQQRHPALSSAIRPNACGEPLMLADACGPVPLRVVEYDGDAASLRNEVAGELARPIDAEVAPLMRCLLLAGDEISELIIVMHHAIADGLSAANLAFELLAHPSPAPPTEPQGFGQPLERLIGLDPQPIRTELQSAPTARDGSTRRWVDAGFLGPAVLDALLERCRAEGATVQSALCVAFARAMRPEASPESPFRCLCPVNARGACGAAEEDMGLYLNYALTSDLTPADPFWDSARQVRRLLQTAQQRDALVERTSFLNHLLSRRRSPAELCSTLEALAGYRVVISNLGRLEPMGPRASYPVSAIRLFLNAEARPSVGVATVDNRMHLTLSAYEPLPGLLDGAIRQLLDATRNPVGAEAGTGMDPALVGPGTPVAN